MARAVDDSTIDIVLGIIIIINPEGSTQANLDAKFLW